MIAAILAAVGMCADGVAEGLYAARHRFSARAAAVGYAAGAGLGWLYGVVTPVTFTVESITVATRTAKERPQIVWIVALSAIPSIALGATGLYSSFVDLLDTAVVGGAIAGVGLILANVGFGYVRERPLTAGLAVVAGFVAFLIWDDLVAVIAASVIGGVVAARLVPDRFVPERELESREEKIARAEDEDVAEPPIERPSFDLRGVLSWPVLVGAFSVFALRTGAVVSYDTVNAELAGTGQELDGVTLMAGVASLGSSLLGGPPIETTPAPMAATPEPVFSTVLFMGAMAVTTGIGLVGRLGRFIPLHAIAGFLVVLGVPVVLPENLPMVLDAAIPGSVALAVTAASNPFYGIVAGQLVVAAIGVL